MQSDFDEVNIESSLLFSSLSYSECIESLASITFGAIKTG